jgi:hypothetical protein
MSAWFARRAHELAVFCILLVVLLVLGMAGKVAVDSRAHYLRAEALAAKARRDGSQHALMAATDVYAKAVLAYVPLVPTARQSLTRLRDIGLELESVGQIRRAQSVWLKAAEASLTLALVYDPFSEERGELYVLLSNSRSHGKPSPK